MTVGTTFPTKTQLIYLEEGLVSPHSILRVEGGSDDMVLLRLTEAHCVPILTYAIGLTDVANRDERRSLRDAYNSIFRKLFGFLYFESVSNLLHAHGRPTWALGRPTCII